MKHCSGNFLEHKPWNWEEWTSSGARKNVVFWCCSAKLVLKKIFLKVSHSRFIWVQKVKNVFQERKKILIFECRYVFTILISYIAWCPFNKAMIIVKNSSKKFENCCFHIWICGLVDFCKTVFEYHVYLKYLLSNLA